MTSDVGLKRLQVWDGDGLCVLDVLVVAAEAEDLREFIEGQTVGDVYVDDPPQGRLRLETDVMGLAEVAELAGVSRQTLSNWRARKDFPKPRYEMRMGPVWQGQRGEILDWLQQNSEGGTS